MSVDRPTFSESWYQVADLHPRLRSGVRTYSQDFRGKRWHVLSDIAANQYFRLDAAAYTLVGLLNGQRTVAEAWAMTSELCGDEAPTQGETIRLLGQLFTANLLHAELPGSAHRLFERYRTRRKREAVGYLTNFLFMRIPLVDPNRLLQRWAPIGGLAFGPIGWLLWASLLVVGLSHLAGRWDEFWTGADPQVMLRTDNLIWLYACFILIKIVHELAHGFACVHFGRRAGIQTPVHAMGIMLLVLMPVPFVDASSAWSLRNKWHRAFIGAAGMYVELAIAAAAAVVWAHSTHGTLTHTLAYNVMFIASISTLIFNGNPLLRFDAYYILSDLLEVANLAQRSKQHFYYLVRKYVYGVRRAVPVAHGTGERVWFPIYGTASTIYRFVITFAILMFVAELFMLIAVFMVLTLLVTWAAMPIFKFIKYLLINPELVRTRRRAMLITTLALAVVLGSIGRIPVPDHQRAEGILAPVQMAEIHMATDGFVVHTIPTGQTVLAGVPIIQSKNPQLEAEFNDIQARIRIARIEHEQARTDDPATAAAILQRIESLGEIKKHIDEKRSRLVIRAPFDGVWVSQDADRHHATWVTQGQSMGKLWATDRWIVHVAAGQDLGPRIEKELGPEAHSTVQIRARGRPENFCEGKIQSIVHGQTVLPSPTLGLMGGGWLPVSSGDETGRETMEPFVSVMIQPDLAEAALTDGPLQNHQAVVVRFDLPARPLAHQWWRSFRQLLQRRFGLKQDNAPTSRPF